METYTVEILEPKAEKLLEDLASLNLIRIEKTEKPKRENRKFGAMKGLVKHIADDFDAPLELVKSEKSPKNDKREFYLSAPVMSNEEGENYRQTREWMNQWRHT